MRSSPGICGDLVSEPPQIPTFVLWSRFAQSVHHPHPANPSCPKSLYNTQHCDLTDL